MNTKPTPSGFISDFLDSIEPFVSEVVGHLPDHIKYNTDLRCFLEDNVTGVLDVFTYEVNNFTNTISELLTPLGELLGTENKEAEEAIRDSVIDYMGLLQSDVEADKLTYLHRLHRQETKEQLDELSYWRNQRDVIDCILRVGGLTTLDYLAVQRIFGMGILKRATWWGDVQVDNGYLDSLDLVEKLANLPLINSDRIIKDTALPLYEKLIS